MWKTTDIKSYVCTFNRQGKVGSRKGAGSRWHTEAVTLRGQTECSFILCCDRFTFWYSMTGNASHDISLSLFPPIPIHISIIYLYHLFIINHLIYHLFIIYLSSSIYTSIHPPTYFLSFYHPSIHLFIRSFIYI